MLKALEQLNSKATVVLKDVNRVGHNNLLSGSTSICGESPEIKTQTLYAISKTSTADDSSASSLNIKINVMEASNCLKRKTPFENYNQSNLESQTSEKINLTTHTQTKKTCIKTSNKGEIEEQHKLNSNEFLHKASKNELQTEKTKAKDSKKGQNVSVSEKKSKKHKKEKKRRKDKSPSSKANRQPLHLEFQQLVEATLKNSDNQQSDDGEFSNSRGECNSSPLQPNVIAKSSLMTDLVAGVSTDKELAAIEFHSGTDLVTQEPDRPPRSDSVVTVPLDLGDAQLSEVPERISSPARTGTLMNDSTSAVSSDIIMEDKQIPEMNIDVAPLSEYINETRSSAAAGTSMSDTLESLPLDKDISEEQERNLVCVPLSGDGGSTQSSLPIGVTAVHVINSEDDQQARASKTLSPSQEILQTTSTKAVEVEVPCHSTEETGTTSMAEASQNSDFVHTTPAAVEHHKLNNSEEEELTIEQLESRENDLLQKKKSTEEHFIESVRKSQTLGKELVSLNSSSTAQKEKLKSKKESIVRMKANVNKILTCAEQHQEQRGLLLFARKEAHQEVLHTEIGLRELQVDLCKQQLQLGFNTHPDESNVTVQTIRDIETKVANLNEQLAIKSAIHKEREGAYADIDLKCSTLVEQYQKLFQDLKEIETEQLQLTEAQTKMDQEIEASKDRLKQSTDEVIAHYCTISNLDLDLTRIASCKKRKKITEERKKFIERMNQFSTLETPQSIDTYLDFLGSSNLFNEMLTTPTPQEHSLQSNESPTSTDISAKHSTMFSSALVPVKDSTVVHVAQTSDGITLPLLENAVSFYEQFCHNTAMPSTNEKGLIQELVVSCHKHLVFKKKLALNRVAQSKETFKQLGFLLKEFITPFYQLMYLKNIPVLELCELVENQARASNWYELSHLDPTRFRKLLLETVKYAIHFSLKNKNIVTNSPRVDYSSFAATPTLTNQQSVTLLDSMVPADTSGTESAANCWTETDPSSSYSTAINPTTCSSTISPSVDQGSQILGNHQPGSSRMRNTFYQTSSSQPTAYLRQPTPSVQPWAHQQYINSPIPVAYPSTSQQHSKYRQQYAHSNFQPADQNNLILSPDHLNSDTVVHQMPVIASLQASSQRMLQQACTPRLHRSQQVVESPLPHNSSLRHNLSQQSTVLHHSSAQNHFHHLEAPQQLPQEHNYRCSCGKEAHQTCSGCEITYYCSRACQVAHWEEHSKNCSKN